jgi:ribose/xylose/arabinose/galactoside ABC-type transport system permease subunit
MIAGGLINEGLTLKMFGVTIYFSIPTIVIIVMIFGAFIGVVNGWIITKFNVAPFIATLGMMYIARGFAMLRSNGATFSNITGKAALGNTGIEFFGRNIGAIPVGAIILAIIAVISSIILKKTPFGWHVLSIGGNQKAAKLSGVKVNKVKIIVYMFSGVCSAIVGIIAASELVAAHPATGSSWEMNAIAATVLGGTSMSGGVGAIGGTIIGAFVIGVINDGLVMMGVSEFWQMVIKGLVIILAVIIDQFQRGLQAKMALQSRNEG